MQQLVIPDHQFFTPWRIPSTAAFPQPFAFPQHVTDKLCLYSVRKAIYSGVKHSHRTEQWSIEQRKGTRHVLHTIITFLSSSHPCFLARGATRVSPWLKAELTRAAFSCSMSCTSYTSQNHWLGDVGKGLCSSSSPQLKQTPTKKPNTGFVSCQASKSHFLNQTDIGEGGKYKIPRPVAHNIPDLRWVYSY